MIEVLISVSILAMLFVGIFNLIDLMLGVTNNNKNYVSAIAYANEKMESIKNLNYDQVGTIAGSPPGIVSQYDYKGIFTIHSTITFHDDAYDGTDSSDPVFTDYKIATVNVSWPTKNGSKDVTVFSKIIPLTEETFAGYGLLKLQIVDANGAPVPGANIHVQKYTATTVDVNLISDINGYYSLPTYPAINAYNVTVTKDGYSSDQTYAASTTNPSPFKPPYTIITANKTEDSLKIDKLATINLKTVSNTPPENFLTSASSTIDKVSKIKAGSDQNNNTYYAWLHSNEANSHVYIQKFNSSNAKQWADNKRIATSTDFQDSPSLAIDKVGNTFVAWDDNSITLKQLASSQPHELALKNQDLPPANTSGTSPVHGRSYASVINNISARWLGYYQAILDSTNNYGKKFLAWLNVDFFNGQDTAVAAAVNVNFVASAGNTTDTASSITINKPAGVLQNDVLIAYIHNNDHNDGALTPPSGWNVLDNDMRPGCGSDDDSRGGIFYKIAGSSEGASYTFNSAPSQSNKKAGQIRAYRNVDTALVFDGALQENYTSKGDKLRPAPSHTVSNDGSLLIAGWGTNVSSLGNSGPQFPSGMANAKNNYANSITALSADLMVNIASSPTGIKNLDATQYVSECTLGWSLVLKPQVLPDDITVSTYGNQVDRLIIPSINQYIGGTFVIKENTSSRNVLSVKVSESGTIDAQADLADIAAYYDLDTTAPYDCAGEQYDPGMDWQFGTTGNFNSADGSVTFSPASSIDITTTKALCLYVTAKINPSAISNETIDLKILNPSTDIVSSSGQIGPSLPIDLPASTVLASDTDLDMVHYRFRYDDGSEASSTWSGNQDAPISVRLDETTRLRFEVVNNGDITSDSISYQLEYGLMESTCAAVSSWHKVLNDDSLDWKISLSSNITDGGPTTNINNGLVDEGSNFVSGFISDVTNPLLPISLVKSNFTELEFSLSPTNNISSENTYCFRLTNQGSTDKFTYSNYPEVSVNGDRNIFITSLDSAGNARWVIKKVNTDVGNTDQTAPVVSITSATTSPTTTVAWLDYRNGNADIYAQSISSDGIRLWTTDLQITSSSTSENSAVISTDPVTNDFAVAWIEDSITEKNIYLQKFNQNKDAVWPAPRLVSTVTGDKNSPNISIGDDSDIYLTWQTIEGSNKKIKIAKLTATGTMVWLKDGNSGNALGNQSQPSITTAGNGIYLAWTDDRDENNDIYAQRINPDGTLQWTNDQRINTNLGTSEQLASFVFANASDEPYASWQDFRNGTASSTYSNVYTTKFSDPGTLNAAPNIPLIISGKKEIGTNVLKFVQKYATDSNGNLALSLEWDPSGYSVVVDPSLSSKSVILTEPTIPLRLLPSDNKNLILYIK